MSCAYDAFLARYREIQAVESAIGLMNWDRQVLMPPGGAEARSAQTVILSRLLHELTTAEDTQRLLEEAEVEVDPTSDEAAALRAFRRDLDIETKLPTEFVERRARLGGEAYEVWKRARTESDFEAMRPYYDELFETAREMSSLLDPAAAHPYDPLFDLYEQGAKVEDADSMFEAIKQPIIDLVHEIVDHGSHVPDAFMYGDWDSQVLRSLAQRMTQDIGFDFSRGRLDMAPSAFCSGSSRQDIRMTTKPSNHVNGVLSSSLHEMGHGLYEQGSPPEWDQSPLAGGVSLAVHESQSRMWENIIGRSRAFWAYFLPALQSAIPAFANLDLDTFWRGMNKVEASFIRVGADELTYNLHILIRYELEVAVLMRRLQARDLPEAWNAKYRQYLGITPTSDGVGVLQDVHWTRGSLGYFPTYSMGNLIGAQIWATLLNDMPEAEDRIGDGEFAPVLAWLQEKVYRMGRRYGPRELVMRVTGEPINPKYWLTYATGKFSGIYDLREPARA